MAHYNLEGTLTALLCDRQFSDSVSDAQILVYRPRPNQNVDQQLAAASKYNFAMLTDAQIQGKQAYLLGHATTNSRGEFSVEFDGGNVYQGGPLQVDVRLNNIKGQSAPNQRTIQFTLDYIDPQWTAAGRWQRARWDHAILSRQWCYALELFDVWVIAGRVVASGSTSGLQGLVVRAFDRDWLQDDLLGQVTTDNNGAFTIYYNSATFKRTPFSPPIFVELVSGPDLYFQVEDSNGNLLVDEQPSKGRTPPRENIGHCYCETLEIGEATPFYDPYFTHVGNFSILTDIDAASGRTLYARDGAGGLGWGFFGDVKLRGFCPKVHPSNGKQMFYRFRYMDPATMTVLPVTPDKITSVLVGSKLVWWDVDGDGVFGWTTQSIRVAGSGATTPVSGGVGPVPDHIIVPDPDGWIAIDQDALDGGFYGPLVRLQTAKIVPGGVAPGSGAGMPPSDPKLGAKLEVMFQTTTATTAGTPDPAAIMTQLATATMLVNNWSEVRELAIEELVSGTAGGCTGLTTNVTIQYTVNHQLVESWSLGMSSAATAFGWTPPTLPSGGTSVAATVPPIAVGSWPACSYTVSLTSRRALTDGEINDSANTVQVTFCKV